MGQASSAKKPAGEYWLNEIKIVSLQRNKVYNYEEIIYTDLDSHVADKRFCKGRDYETDDWRK